MKFAKLNPKRLFRSKDRATVSKSTASSGSASSFSSGAADECNNHSSAVTGGSVTPTSILPEVSAVHSPYSYVEILQAFKLIDRDNDGAVSRHDLESLLTRLGPDPPTEEEIDVMLKEVRARLTEQEYNLELTSEVEELLTNEGYNPSYGARPLRRAIQRLIEDPLAEEILTGALQKGTILAKRDGEKVVFAMKEGEEGTKEKAEAGV